VYAFKKFIVFILTDIKFLYKERGIFMRRKNIAISLFLIAALFSSNVVLLAEETGGIQGLGNQLENGSVSSAARNDQAANSGSEVQAGISDQTASKVAAGTSETEVSGGDEKFGGVYPGNGRVTSSFGWRIHPVKKTRKFHTGIDISVPSGTTMYAIGDGIVVSSETQRGYGNTILVMHNINGKVYYSRYAHLSKRAPVGTKVERGKPIAGTKSGNTGMSTGAHLHFEVLDANKKTVDPMKFIDPSKYKGDSNANADPKAKPTYKSLKKAKRAK